MSERETRALIDVVVGVQWGDEGKGRVVDAIAGDYEIVARFGGGDNAGHTLVVGDRRVALRIVPSGALRERPRLFIGGGCVVSLETLDAELTSLAALGVDTRRVSVSDRAEIVLPQHRVIDRAMERLRGETPLGTTGRGIGPAYADRAARVGVRFSDLRDPARLAEAVRANLRVHRPLLEAAGESFDEMESALDLRSLAERLAPHVVDGVAFIHDALERGERVLAEGAQGTLLDLSYGLYPFVTSSSTLAGGVCTGLGVGPSRVGKVVGIAKAYCTRVGEGPFPSEIEGEAAERLRSQGAEFGTVTGRPRRCGWFDAVAARYASRLCGLNEIVITKLDVLTGFERIGFVSHYARGGTPAEFGEPDSLPIIEWLEGWSEPISEIRRRSELPAAARHYVERIESAFGARVRAVSVGPERSAIIPG